MSDTTHPWKQYWVDRFAEQLAKIMAQVFGKKGDEILALPYPAPTGGSGGASHSLMSDIDVGNHFMDAVAYDMAAKKSPFWEDLLGSVNDGDTKAVSFDATANAQDALKSYLKQITQMTINAGDTVMNPWTGEEIEATKTCRVGVDEKLKRIFFFGLPEPIGSLESTLMNLPEWTASIGKGASFKNGPKFTEDAQAEIHSKAVAFDLSDLDGVLNAEDVADEIKAMNKPPAPKPADPPIIPHSHKRAIRLTEDEE